MFFNLFQIERIKRVNNLWSNDSIIAKDNLFISSTEDDSDKEFYENTTKNTFYVKPKCQKHKKDSYEESFHSK